MNPPPHIHTLTVFFFYHKRPSLDPHQQIPFSQRRPLAPLVAGLGERCQTARHTSGPSAAACSSARRDQTAPKTNEHYHLPWGMHSLLCGHCVGVACTTGRFRQGLSLLPNHTLLVRIVFLCCVINFLITTNTRHNMGE